MVGYSSEELLARDYADVFRGNSKTENDDCKRLLAGRILAYSKELSTRRKDGRDIWVKAFVSLVRDEVTNAPKGFLLVIDDMTPLKNIEVALKNSELARDELSRRMMNAQEADRTRIARELHDEIGQSLALLKIQLLQPGTPATSPRGNTPPDLNELAAEVQAIAAKVTRLSHDLHSAELEFLGLAVALESQCRECSDRFEIRVDYSRNDVGRNLGGIVPLAFLRVAQEALHNVAKHSHATTAQVDLTRTGDELILTIADDGVGTDLRRRRQRAGLGLISMRERMHLIGGELEIYSKPGKGTTVRAHAPLAKAKPPGVERPRGVVRPHGIGASALLAPLR
jgi:PAS domain S-box-containing protein